MVRISQGLLHRGLGRRVGLLLFSNCGGVKNQGSGAYLLKDGYRLSCKIQTHQRRFKASQRETFKPTRADTDMAHPMDSEQFREAAKAAIDDSKFLCFYGVYALRSTIFYGLFWSLLFHGVTFSEPSNQSHFCNRYNIVCRFVNGCSELRLVLSQTMRNNAFVTAVMV